MTILVDCVPDPVVDQLAAPLLNESDSASHVLHSVDVPAPLLLDSDVTLQVLSNVGVPDPVVDHVPVPVSLHLYSPETIAVSASGGGSMVLR